MRTLILGAMPEGARPETHLAAGAWCFAGREDLFPGWDEPGGFPLPEDPFADGASMAACAARANGAASALLEPLAREANRLRGTGHSLTFWETALAPWLLLCVQMLAERQKRVEMLVKAYGRLPLQVDLVPVNAPFSFATSLDFFQRGVLSVAFNHYIFSRFVEALAPDAWRLRFLPPDPCAPAGPGPSWTERCKRPLADLLRRLPFPRQKGFSLAQCLRLSLAVRANAGSVPDASLPLRAYGDAPLPWAFDVLPLVRKCLPAALVSAPVPRVKNRRNALYGMTAAAAYDDRYRLRLAALREGGARLFSLQHGANYGNLRSPGAIIWEYSQHAFLTWGWSRHAGVPCNAAPISHPLVARVANRHAQTHPTLLLVGTEMSTLLYRLKSRPQAGQLVAYRRQKAEFIEALEPRVRASAAYRPYFSTPAGLEDGAWLRRRFPEVPLCAQDFERALLGCRLLVLDHYGTTLHLALAANVPTLCYWPPENWPMEEGTVPLLELLRRAGLLHDSAREAATRANALWRDVHAWWSGDQVQAARQAWLERYARCAGRPADACAALARLVREL